MTAPLASSLISPEAAPNENPRRELQARLAGLGDLKGKKLTPEQKDKKLREACEGFESVFIQKMWQEMRNTLPKGGLLQGRDEKLWQDMYDQELSKKMTSAGGIGLADMMYSQLSRNLVSASRSAAGSGRASGFTPGAAPLLSAPAEDTSGTPEDAAANAARAAGKEPQGSAGRGAAIPYEGVAPQTGVVEADSAEAASRSASEAAAAGNAPAGPPLNPPEVEQALAALRAGQIMTPPAQGHIEAVPAGQGVRRHSAPSGLELARMAQREAGTKLGPNTVRPPLQPVTRPLGFAAHNAPGPEASAAAVDGPVAAHAAAPSATAVPGGQTVAAPSGQAVGTPAAVRAAQAAPAAQAGTAAQTQSAAAGQAVQDSRDARDAQTPEIRTVRYTTNIPAKGRSKRGQALIRTLNTDGTNAGSRAGAGLAAYHAAQAQAADQAAARQAAQPGESRDAARGPEQIPAQAVPARDSRTMPPPPTPAAADARSAGGNGAEGGNGYAIPPLTAGDLRG